MYNNQAVEHKKSQCFRTDIFCTIYTLHDVISLQSACSALGMFANCGPFPLLDYTKYASLIKMHNYALIR